jgi:hypothetical protein
MVVHSWSFISKNRKEIEKNVCPINVSQEKNTVRSAQRENTIENGSLRSATRKKRV